MRNARLDVPLYRQPVGSRTCGAYAAKMVLASFGERVSANRLVRELRCKGGVWDIALAAWFAAHGYDVSMFMWSELFPASFLEDAEDTALNERRLLEWSRRGVSDDCPNAAERRAYRRHLPEFFAHGGLYFTQPFSPEDLRRVLGAGVPPIVSVDAATLTRGRTPFDPHYLVVTGANTDLVRVNDPNFEPSGGKRVHPWHEFLFSAYRTGGSMIVAAPKDCFSRR